MTMKENVEQDYLRKQKTLKGVGLIGVIYITSDNYLQTHRSPIID